MRWAPLPLLLFATGCFGDTRPLEATDGEDAAVNIDVGSMIDSGTMAGDSGVAFDAGPAPVDAGPPDAGFEGLGVGEPCDAPELCASADSAYASLPPTACVRWPDGYCTDFCQLPADPYTLPLLVQADCPNGAICLPRAPYVASDEDIGACVLECTTDSDCRADEGYFCRRTFWRQDGELNFDNGYCAPPHCQSRACPIGISCEC